MAMIKCPECGNEISSTSKQCIKCGYILRKHASTLSIIAFILSFIACFNIIAFVMAVIDIFNEDRSLTHGFSIAAVIISILTFFSSIFIIGILSLF